jgi:hypothetical protein
LGRYLRIGYGRPGIVNRYLSVLQLHLALLQLQLALGHLQRHIA